ncbi:unnamed protein product, partial [Mesorhabditis spiculigera]
MLISNLPVRPDASTQWKKQPDRNHDWGHRESEGEEDVGQSKGSSNENSGGRTKYHKLPKSPGGKKRSKNKGEASREVREGQTVVPRGPDGQTVVPRGPDGMTVTPRAPDVPKEPVKLKDENSDDGDAGSQGQADSDHGPTEFDGDLVPISYLQQHLQPMFEFIKTTKKANTQPNTSRRSLPNISRHKGNRRSRKMGQMHGSLLAHCSSTL